MQLHRIGKRNYAFGLTWLVVRENTMEAIEATQNGEISGLVYEVTLTGPAAAGGSEVPVRSRFPWRKRMPAGERVVGFTIVEDRLSGDVYSYAAGLAALGRDGLYVAPLSDNAYWYCGIQNGVVISNTDATGLPDAVRTIVENLSQIFGLQIYAAAGIDIDGASNFDFEKALESSKERPLRVLRKGASPVAPILATGIIALLGFGGYRLAYPPQPKLTPEQQQALARQSYVSSVQSTVKDLPVDADWVLTAFLRARDSLPPFVSGWDLAGVTCEPRLCKALYTTDGRDTFAVSPLIERFGPRVTFSADGHTATVAMPQDTAMQAITEQYLRALPVKVPPFLDWVGSVPLHMGGAKIDGQLFTNDLSARFNAAAAAMPALTMEQASIKAEFAPDRILLGEVVRAGSRGGYVPVKFAWSMGAGHVPASWRMTWTRLHG